MRHAKRRANGSIMRELEEGALPHFKAHDGLQICHALLKVAVPLMRATGCPQITYADTIQHFGALRGSEHACRSGFPSCLEERGLRMYKDIKAKRVLFHRAQ